MYKKLNHITDTSERSMRWTVVEDFDGTASDLSEVWEVEIERTRFIDAYYFKNKFNAQNFILNN